MVLTESNEIKLRQIRGLLYVMEILLFYVFVFLEKHHPPVDIS